MRLQGSVVAERRERFLDLVGGGPEIDKSSLLPDKSCYCLLNSDGDGVVVESYLPDNDAQEFGRCASRQEPGDGQSLDRDKGPAPPRLKRPGLAARPSPCPNAWQDQMFCAFISLAM